MNKYEKIRDQISDLLDSYGYDHKVYDEDGKSTSDIREARYIFCNNPNFMVIVRTEENEVEFNKGKMEIELFKEIIQKLRNITKSLFVRLHVMAINNHIVPKQYSKDVQRNKRRLDRIVTEGMIDEYPMNSSENSNYLCINEDSQKVTLSMGSEMVDITGFGDNIVDKILNYVIEEEISLTDFNNLVEFIQAKQLVSLLGESYIDSKQINKCKKLHDILRE